MHNPEILHKMGRCLAENGAAFSHSYYNVNSYDIAIQVVKELKLIGVYAVVSSPAGNTWQVRLHY